jgi:large subunit ribosomal protein L7/L12
MTLDQNRLLQEQLNSLSLLEAAELVKQIEESFGVSAAAPVGVAAAPPAEAAEEQTEFNVVLESLADESKKIAVLKVVRAITGLGLKEAKDLVESAPRDVLTGVPKATVEDAKKQLEDAGARVSIPYGIGSNLYLRAADYSLNRFSKESEIDTIFTQMGLSDLRIQSDQEEIDQLKVDTRKMIANLTSLIK